MGKRKILTAKGGSLDLRKWVTALKMAFPLFVLRRRTNKSVGAYFDLITDDGRAFYGDNFHFGIFLNGTKTLEDALNNHTDIVSKMACIKEGDRVLDIGCGIGAPAVRIANQTGSHITGINISREQIRHAMELVEVEGLADQIDVQHGNALELDFEDASFDSALCIEVAGDICVKDVQKVCLVEELYRILKPGGHIGFSDLVFTGNPTSEEEKSMRTILYHEGKELLTDWPSLFRRCGFVVKEERDYIKETMETWTHSADVYEERLHEVEKRYGKRIAASSLNHLRRIPEIMEKYGSFMVMSIEKPIQS